MTKLAIKIEYGNELRRIQFNSETIGITFQEIHQTLVQLFQFSPSTQLKIQYLDDESEWINITNDLELQFAFQLFSSDHILRLKIRPLEITNELFDPTSLAPQFIFNNNKQNTSLQSNIETFRNNNESLFIQGKMAGRFVCHVNVPDDTKMSPGTKFMKTWRFRNETDNFWPPNCKLLFIGKGGDRMSGPEFVLINHNVGPGEEVVFILILFSFKLLIFLKKDISVPLIAPSHPGRYIGYWRLAGPLGNKFGQRVRVQIQVFIPK